MNTCLNFGGDPDHRPATGIVFRICHYMEIRKVVNGYKSAGTISCSYRRGTARRAVSVKFLSTGAKLCDKSHLKRFTTGE